MAWEPNWYEKNLGYPQPKEFKGMSQHDFDTLLNGYCLSPTKYEYARLEEFAYHMEYLRRQRENNSSNQFDEKLELGWLQWGKSLKMKREDYESLYKKCTNWSEKCESPIECILYNDVINIGLDPLVNLTLGDMLCSYKRDIAGRFEKEASDRYDQVYLTRDEKYPYPILIVECDGEEAHSKEEHIKRDAEKEYNLNIHFPHIFVLRFTGSEIKNSSKKCGAIIKNTYDFLASIHNQLIDNPDMVKQLRKTAIYKLVKQNLNLK
ncbi:hypothetical protein [Bacillus cereus]|uniref:hypothetical protein n=1 Tax=Bacillus cereus TaxID=1396 RepID=UPI003D088AD6